jgi:hypothetical protein
MVALVRSIVHDPTVVRCVFGLVVPADHKSAEAGQITAFALVGTYLSITIAAQSFDRMIHIFLGW